MINQPNKPMTGCIDHLSLMMLFIDIEMKEAVTDRGCE